MKTKWLRSLVLISVLATMLISNVAFAADDGPLFERNISRSPDTPSSAAQISAMHLYVPAQTAAGVLIEEDEPIEYLAGDCTNQNTDGCEVITTMTEAKPLITTYIDGVGEPVEAEGDLSIATGTGFGERDLFASMSLDDGATWKDYNLSDSALRSSFVLKNGLEYPGDVFRQNHVIVGNRVAVAWISRFCESGSPLYSWVDDDKDALLTAYPDLVHPVNVDNVTEPYELYVDDLFGVGGAQKSVDYTLQGFPEVGEIPYGCVWVARGTLEEVEIDDAGTLGYDITWRVPERLTSGRRDANRVDITGTGGAGFIISWQEDPEGLRPGKGLGPGEGWSGAIANSKTDIWYTQIGWDDFDDVCLDDPDTGLCDIGELSEFELETKPKIAVPFAVPVRLTDNNQCKGVQKTDTDGALLNPYCYADFDESGIADLCANSVSWTNPDGSNTLEICQTEDGRVLTGRTSSTRVRWAIKPYTKNDGTTGAWVTMAEEKMKALGTELDDNDEPIDIGKNMWYHTFEFNNPELVQQGLMLNAPAVDYETEAVFPVHVDEWGNEYWETEIARRFNLMVQGIGATMASENKTSALLIWKEGILFQGGPADIFMRRVVLPDNFDATVDNPFAYENVQCVPLDDTGVALEQLDLLYADGSNPNYVRGLCPVQGMNVSGTTIVTCDDGSGGDACAASFPWDADGDTEQNSYPKVTQWEQTVDNLNDPSWTNPYDVSKGHRGFIDGDFIMMMYATAPNWKANTIGNEAYNLYIRRSFDGGQTWTTLPASFTHINGETYTGDGTESCEDYGWGGQVEEEFCTTYGAGEFEQARNVSRLTGSKITVLDPRYSPTGGMLKLNYTNLLCDDDRDGVWENCGYTAEPYPEELRNPSTYFVTYEVGDNTVVTVETGTVPMDMHYSRAFNFGDDYDTVDWLMSDGTTEERWDYLEHGEEISEEASVYGNPDGSKFYAFWSEELDLGDEHYTNMDSIFRRVFYNLTDTDAYPTTSFLYTSDMTASFGETVTFAGGAKDNDWLGDELDGIVEYEWTSSIQGKLPSTGNSFTMEAGTGSGKLWAGYHTISFRAKDNEGNWSQPAETMILVGESISFLFMPMTIR